MRLFLICISTCSYLRKASEVGSMVQGRQHQGGTRSHALSPPLFCVVKKIKKGDKGFKAETIKPTSPSSKYCFSHSRASTIQKFFLSSNHGGQQQFSVFHSPLLWNPFCWPCGIPLLTRPLHSRTYQTVRLKFFHHSSLLLLSSEMMRLISSRIYCVSLIRCQMIISDSFSSK